MIDLDELERKAKAAGKDECGFSWPDESEWLELFDHCQEHGRFISAFNPSVAQELINRLRDAEKDAARYRHIISTGKFAPDLYGDSGIALSGRLNKCTKAEIDKYVDYAIAKGKGNG